MCIRFAPGTHYGHSVSQAGGLESEGGAGQGEEEGLELGTGAGGREGGHITGQEAGDISTHAFTHSERGGQWGESELVEELMEFHKRSYATGSGRMIFTDHSNASNERRRKEGKTILTDNEDIINEVSTGTLCYAFQKTKGTRIKEYN